jgi:hypothetical protein
MYCFFRVAEKIHRAALPLQNFDKLRNKAENRFEEFFGRPYRCAGVELTFPYNINSSQTTFNHRRLYQFGVVRFHCFQKHRSWKLDFGRKKCSPPLSVSGSVWISCCELKKGKMLVWACNCVLEWIHFPLCTLQSV